MADHIRKYQIFISATYSDLIEERKQAFFAIMTARQIPVGMENFTATNDRGWGLIKRVIDMSDYYVVIVAGRYGSVDPETKMSWTEREYRYAREKGIKTLAFLRADAAITREKMDVGPVEMGKLNDFKTMLRNAHLCSEWSTGEELARKISEALTNQIRDDLDDGTAPMGWIRGVGSQLAAEEMARLLDENRTLREELDILRSRPSKAVKKVREPIFEISTGSSADGTTIKRVIPREGPIGLRPLAFNITNRSTSIIRKTTVMISVQGTNTIWLSRDHFGKKIDAPVWDSLRNVCISRVSLAENTVYISQTIQCINPGSSVSLVAFCLAAEERVILHLRAYDEKGVGGEREYIVFDTRVMTDGVDFG